MTHRLREFFIVKNLVESTGMVMINSGILSKLERHVVLTAPEVHWNTGNVGRTCLGAGAWLHLIKPLGFSLDSKQVKRAGLDYWDQVKLLVWDDFNAFLRHMRPQDREVAIFTKNGKRPFWEMPVAERMFLIFGAETKGLPEEILSAYGNSSFYIPMTGKIRCLNLSTSVGIALYESIRPGRGRVEKEEGCE